MCCCCAQTVDLLTGINRLSCPPAVLCCAVQIRSQLTMQYTRCCTQAVDLLTDIDKLAHQAQRFISNRGRRTSISTRPSNMPKSPASSHTGMYMPVEAWLCDVWSVLHLYRGLKHAQSHTTSYKGLFCTACSKLCLVLPLYAASGSSAMHI